MRKEIPLQHRVCDYNCMLSGLEDMLEQYAGHRFPSYFVFLCGFIGFHYETTADGLSRVGPGYGVGRTHYTHFSGTVPFQWHSSAGNSFGETWDLCRKLIDEGKPVIIGELDMFHLSYLKKFYHRIHVPYHYITLVGYDEEKESALIQDCGREDVEEIKLKDLQKAVDRDRPGICRRNTVYWFDINKSNSVETNEIIRKSLHRCAEKFLTGENSGLAALKRFISDFPRWMDMMPNNRYQASLRHLVTFTCSWTPMPPQPLVPFPLEPIFLSHHGIKDRWAKLLLELEESYGIKNGGKAAEYFVRSGQLYQQATEIITGYLKAFNKKKEFPVLSRIPSIFEEIAELEEQGFRLLRF